jgi:RNA-directed DNA polymerase
MLREILSEENMTRAFTRVKSNKGASGVDGMTVDELAVYLNERWKYIRAELYSSTYKPSPVKKVEIGSRPILGD